MKKKIVFVLTFFLSATFFHLLAAEEDKMLADSLYFFANSSEKDTVRMNNILAFYQRHTCSENLSIKTFGYLSEIAGRNEWGVLQNYFLREQGYWCQMTGRTDEANICYASAAKIAEEARDTNGIVQSYYRQGYLLNGVGRPLEAIEAWKKIVPVRNDLGTQAFLYMVIGAAYLNTQDSTYEELAKEYSYRAYEMMLADSANAQISITLANLASLAMNDLDYELAIKYVDEGIELSGLRNYDPAPLQIKLAQIRYLMGDYEEARKLYEAAVPYSLAYMNNYDRIGFAYDRYKANQKTGHISEALESLEMAYALKDSIFKIERQQSLDDALEKYNSEKKQLEIEKQKLRAENENKDKVAAEKAKSTQFYIFLVIVLVLIANAIFVYNRFILTRKQNTIIAQQKELVEQKKIEAEFQRQLVEAKQKEILDSIAYAKRLQNAILAPESEIVMHFPEQFLFYKPKDIVAGDFYFFEATSDHVFYAAADCTGHGVPGAMVSMVCSNALTRSIKEFGLTEPGKILDKTKELVVETFEKSGENVKDGMDISLIAKSKSSGRISWAGANNPLWILRKGSVVMEEVKGDKQPIGKFDNANPFVTHPVEVNQGDIIYLFTDGYADQFGGDKGRKFKNSSLKELLVMNASLAMKDQKRALNDTFEVWKGSLEQLDDVCVIGIRIE